LAAPVFEKSTDPYKNYRVKVKIDNDYVMGCNKFNMLAGGDPSVVRTSPGQTSYDPIILEEGFTHDPAFEAWANKSWDDALSKNSNDVSLQDFRKDIIIELYNEAGQEVMAYNVLRALVSEYQAMPQLNGDGSETTITSIKFEHEGWTREANLKEPTEDGY
jgi:phage tail-like protein